MTTTTRHRRFAAESIEFETLESRELLAAFGTPWQDPRSLTLSFPADGTNVGEYSNDLHETMDAITARQNWQELALRAYQTWSVYADINVGLRNDYDLDFGAPGLSKSDPRFGDFRIGAFPQVGVLANAVPFQAVAGTNSGDILVNSNETFTYHDWSNGLAPDPATQQPGQHDLFSVLLHESGNTLGLTDTHTAWTVMFGQYTAPKGTLTPEDIDAIQALYGARTDPYELIGNDQLQLATLIPAPVGFQPETDVIDIGGSLLSATDVDYYEITPVAGQDEVTLGLKASGISLVKTRLQVLDANGTVLQQSVTDSVFENDHTLQIDGLQNHPVLYLRVSAVDQDVFSVGDYQISVDYRSAAAQAADPTPGSFDSGVDSLFTNFALEDQEQGVNDTTGDAALMAEAAGFASQTRYEVHSAVSGATDVDYWKLTSPSTASQRLVVNVAGTGLDQPGIRVRLVDAAGNPVGASGRLNPDGRWTLEVAQPAVGQDYYLRVSVDPNSTVQVGNYVATAEFVIPDDQMNHLVSGDVTSTVDDFVLWTAAKSRLYRFDLGVQGASVNEGVRLTIYDAHTHELRMVLNTNSDRTRSGFAWLAEGDYILRFTAYSRTGAAVNQINYSLTSDGVSDDQDPDPDPPPEEENYDYYAYEPEQPPNVDDPSGDPDYYYEYYYYYSSS